MKELLERKELDWTDFVSQLSLISLIFPPQQVSVREINQMLLLKQDDENLRAIPTAQLARLTYNMNRGKDNPPLEDITGFLPYPQRYQIKKNLHLVADLSRQACYDILRFCQTSKETKITGVFYDWLPCLQHRIKE